MAVAADDNEAMIRRYIDEVFNGHNLDGLERYWAEDAVATDEPVAKALACRLHRSAARQMMPGAPTGAMS